MNEPILWMLSINAFAAVIILLSLLGGVLRLMTAVFPPNPKVTPSATARTSTTSTAPQRIDAAVVTAIQTAVQRAYPGAQVRDVRLVEEEQLR